MFITLRKLYNMVRVIFDASRDINTHRSNREARYCLCWNRLRYIIIVQADEKISGFSFPMSTEILT